MFVKITTRALGITVEVRNSKILEEDRGALLTLNHQSALDVIRECNMMRRLEVTAGVKVNCFLSALSDGHPAEKGHSDH